MRNLEASQHQINWYRVIHYLDWCWIPYQIVKIPRPHLTFDCLYKTTAAGWSNKVGDFPQRSLDIQDRKVRIRFLGQRSRGCITPEASPERVQPMVSRSYRIFLSMNTDAAETDK